MSNRKDPVIVKQDFEAPAQVVWAAITDPTKMNRWFFKNIAAFEAREGFETSFDVEADGLLFTHQWRILEVSTGRSVKYHWSYAQFPGVGYVTFEVIPRNTGSSLKLTNEGLDSFPEDISAFSRENCEGGWDFFIRQNLAAFVAGKAVSPY